MILIYKDNQIIHHIEVKANIVHELSDVWNDEI